MEFTRTIRTTQVDKNPIHTGHPSPAEILLYSCGTDRPDRLLYLYHTGWPGLSCREVDLDIGVKAARIIRIGRGDLETEVSVQHGLAHTMTQILG